MAPVVAKRGDGDWFSVAWDAVYAATGLSPTAIPGVRALSGKLATELPLPTDAYYPAMAGPSARPPYPFHVHRCALPAIGAVVEDGPAVRMPRMSRIELRPHQVEGVKYIRSRRGTLLADEMRVGKTPQVIAAHDPESGCLFIIAPLAARIVWHEWAARRFGPCVEALRGAECLTCARVGAFELGLDEPGPPSFLALTGREPVSDVFDARPRVIFCHFQIAAAWSLLFDEIDLGTLAIDEAHKGGLQSRKNLATRAVRIYNTRASRVIAITGTPLYNRPDGMWPVLDIVAPQAWGNFWDFARRYCDAKPGPYGWSSKGVSHVEELQLRMAEVMLRRTWLEIRGSLPAFERNQELVALPADLVDAVIEQACRIQMEGRGAKTQVGQLARLRRMFAKSKVTAAVAWTEAVIAEGRSAVLWTWHREVADDLVVRLTESGIRAYGPISGDVPARERDELLEMAASCPTPRVLIATMDSLGFAVNLSWASHACFVELDWIPSNVAQAEMRIFDGANAVSITFLVADVDTDRKLADALLAKLGTAHALGLRAGVGDVADVLRASLRIEAQQTLDDLAEALIADADVEV